MVDTAPEPDEEELVRALYAEHAGPLFGYVLGLVRGDRQHAEDVVQETLLRAWQHPQSVAGRRARPWLLAVARNLVIDRWRAGRVRATEVPMEELTATPVPDEVDRAVETWLVADALESLTAEHRGVIVELYFRGRSVAEAAAVLGVPTGTVKSRAFYAIRALRAALQDRGVTE